MHEHFFVLTKNTCNKQLINIIIIIIRTTITLVITLGKSL